MADENPPQLPRTQAVALEDALITIDQRYWDILRAFQANPHGGESGNRQNPPIPKRPAALLAAFASYASALFLAEANTYPPSPNLRRWLEQLRERVNDRVAGMVDHLETQGTPRGVSLGFHDVPGEELRAAVIEELNGRIEKQLNPTPPRKTPNPPLELDHRMSAPLRPPLPPEVKAQLQSGSYVRAGIDVASASPLVVAVVNEAISKAKGNPQKIIPTESAQNARRTFVIPLLEAKGWSILDWANEANLAYHTAADYLAGKRAPYPSTKKKLAEALGISIEQLPR